MTEPNRPLSDLVRRLRARSGLSIRQLEEASGINRANLSRLERGEASRPQPETLTRLAEVFGIDASELLTAAGYTADKASALPSLPMYLRSKYAHLPASARKDLADYVTRLETEYGGAAKSKPKTARKKNI
ncbi:MAG: helix-turn-helix domain-containing protein [Acidimicrobiales bacterium]